MEFKRRCERRLLSPIIAAMHILVIAIEQVTPRCQSQVNYHVLLDLQGFLPVVGWSVSVTMCILHTCILGLANKLWGKLEVGLVSGVSEREGISILYRTWIRARGGMLVRRRCVMWVRVERCLCCVGYITSLDRYVLWIGFLGWERSGIDRVKDYRAVIIIIIKSLVVWA